MPVISVVIPVYNSLGTLEACLDSVLAARAEFGDVELLVVDNGSTDGSFEFLKGKYGHIATIHQHQGGTIAAQRNRGARSARGEYIYFLDSDCIVQPGYFHALMRVFSEIRPDATGSKCELPSSPSWCEETWQRLHRRSRDGYVNYLNSGNFVVRKTAFEAVGGFNEALETDEDYNLGERLRAAGFAIYESHALAAVHLRNAKTVLEFFRKEVWRGLGMARESGSWYRDKVLLMTLAHLLLNIVGLLGFVFLPVPWKWRVAGLAACLLGAPMVSVIYRFATLKRFYRPLASLLLYRVWLDAKVTALCLRLVGAR